MKFMNINLEEGFMMLQHTKRVLSHRNYRATCLAVTLLLQTGLARAAEPVAAKTSIESPVPAVESAQTAQNGIPFDRLLRRSYNPIDAYRGQAAPPPSLANSVRLDALVRNGKLYLSLRDAIDLALEDNLDMVIARYNLPIAQTDILLTQSGGIARGERSGRRLDLHVS